MLAIVTIGISASGKSTWANSFASKQDCVISNRDDIRFSTFCNGERNWSKYKFTQANEEAVTYAQYQQWVEAAKQSRTLIVCDTNLNRNRCKTLCEKLEKLGYDIIHLKYFDITLEDAIKRDSIRPESVGENVIRKQYNIWVKEKYGKYILN